MTRRDVRRIRLVVFLVVLLVGSILGVAIGKGIRAGAGCQEDRGCWSWATMGNLDRGVVLRDGTWTTVDACRFAYLDHRGRIDWTRTRPLRGDGLARARGCDPRLFAPSH